MKNGTEFASPLSSIPNNVSVVFFRQTVPCNKKRHQLWKHFSLSRQTSCQQWLCSPFCLLTSNLCTLFCGGFHNINYPSWNTPNKQHWTTQKLMETEILTLSEAQITSQCIVLLHLHLRFCSYWNTQYKCLYVCFPFQDNGLWLPPAVMPSQRTVQQTSKCLSPERIIISHTELASLFLYLFRICIVWVSSMLFTFT